MLHAVLATIASGAARADAVEDFYKGKTVTLYIGTTPGGGLRHLCASRRPFPGRAYTGPSRDPAGQYAGRRWPNRGGTYLFDRRERRAVARLVRSSAAACTSGGRYDDQIRYVETELDRQHGFRQQGHGRLVPLSGVKTIEDARREDVTMGAPAETTGPQYLGLADECVCQRHDGSKSSRGYPGINETQLWPWNAAKSRAGRRHELGDVERPSPTCCAITRSTCSWCKSAFTRWRR